MSVRNAVLAILLFAGSCSSVVAENYRAVAQYPWNLFIDVDTAGSYTFAPVIDAQTMQAFQFAFATDRSPNRAELSGSLYSPEWVSKAMNAFTGLYGSGASPYLIFTHSEPVPEPIFWMPEQTAFVNGEAPPWDPDNPPEALPIYFGDEDPFPADPDPTAPATDPAVDISGLLGIPPLGFPAGGATPRVVLDASAFNTSIPEPSTVHLSILGIGILGIAVYQRACRNAFARATAHLAGFKSFRR